MDREDNFRKQQISFDFQKELAFVTTPEELIIRTTSFLKSLKWKKKNILQT